MCFIFSNRKFTVRTVINIAVQGIRILEKLHKKGFIHRDIRPENFLIGPGNSKNQLYLIDFSLARRYISVEGEQLPEKTNLKFIGTVRYASIAAHIGKTQGRKDDL
ncbi:UNVERIFIED_CONTAM: hypothetical protein GTU68_052929 [Idotea baltica]|nr:hypothetical protein [Idotea baltica]